MRVLWIATKAPWPPRDGGRLVQHLTLEALASLGVELTVVAPVERVEPVKAGASSRDAPAGVSFEAVSVPAGTTARGRLRTLVRALVGEPWTVAAHRHAEVATRVAELLDRGVRENAPFGVVHCEQIQAWSQSAPARWRGVPVVLRAQNVESDLWRGMAELEAIGWPATWLLRWQGRRLAGAEARAIRASDAVVALTEPDRERLELLASRAGGGQPKVVSIPAPFPSRLPAGERRLAGDPPVVFLGSAGWPPNRDAETWLLRDLWPAVRGELPGAVLHVFGGDAMRGGECVESADSERAVRHPAPIDSRDAFAPGSVLVVPLRLASGVRMKILEAWARGVPVVATPTAARGLGHTPGRQLLEMEEGVSLAAALRRLATDSRAVEGLARQGRERLDSHHPPSRVGRRLLDLYRQVTAPPSQPSNDRA